MSENRQYKYMLRKGSKKDICPVCGEKRFVPYVLASDGVTPAGCNDQGQAYGRCDREQECGYFCYPKGETRVNAEPLRKVEVHPIRFDRKKIELRMGAVSLCSELWNYFLREIAPHTHNGVSEVFRVWQEYRVGSVNGQPLFWQIDTKGEIHAGKTIPYKEDGHRDHDAKYPAYFLHKDKMFADCVTGSELQQVFFGSHLLPRYPDKPVCVVESEKTALAMSVFDHGAHVWLATGGSQMIKDRDRCAMLAGRDVTLYPDQGQYDQWSAVANRYGWKVDTTMEEHGGKGEDILDYVLKNIEGNEEDNRL